MDPAQLLEILQLIETIVPGVISIGTQAAEAFQANDQATLDAAHDRARALADSLKPAGV